MEKFIIEGLLRNEEHFNLSLAKQAYSNFLVYEQLIINYLVDSDFTLGLNEFIMVVYLLNFHRNEYKELNFYFIHQKRAEKGLTLKIQMQ